MASGETGLLPEASLRLSALDAEEGLAPWKTFFARPTHPPARGVSGRQGTTAGPTYRLVLAHGRRGEAPTGASSTKDGDAEYASA